MEVRLQKRVATIRPGGRLPRAVCLHMTQEDGSQYVENIHPGEVLEVMHTFAIELPDGATSATDATLRALEAAGFYKVSP